MEIQLEEMEEIKERMMVERRRIYEDGEKSTFDKGDLSLRKNQLKTEQEFLSNERERMNQQFQ